MTETMKATPIRALDKRLRDGRRFTLDLVPEHGSKWGYWMQATVDGKIIYDRFTAPVRRNCTELPELPHVILIQFLEEDPNRPGNNVNRDRPVGLTDAEADQIDAAKLEWTDRYRRAALAAAPDAPTWQLPNWPVSLSTGRIVWDHELNEPVMVLHCTERWGVEDGRSFGLDAEDGNLYDATVRALTPDERAEWDAEQDAERCLDEALAAAQQLFGWGQHGPRPADAEQVDQHPDGDKVYLPGHGQCLIRADDDNIYAVLFGAGSYLDGTVCHPTTAEQAAVFETLLAASDRGHLH